ncbi:hypothetical protein OH77DRAFT_1588381 [Trametes cingulata]|nr:hypothetical protein OH77DRAFT_1588381 [Trametes cingulata]
MIPPPQPPQEATDIFSISDQVLADRLQFIEEIGFGNWGSVWLCRPKSSSGEQLRESKIAVKLVHRSKTSTTAARVRSLWNEMKVVRSLKHEPHPSIIPFYSFIITPSYALITMAYHPRLITVEVSEPHAKEWFRSLLSGVEFLHKRGVVHNDIKPANILLSDEDVPVLVDFGFAERYDVDATDAFHSNLSYGTPEYLSPERARGLPHDTRKSDVWSLGVTFFEILVGRTPFEHSDGETFASKDDLERYWARTLRGKWVGSWRMSKGAERLLKRMILPNADLRCTASEAMQDPYWTAPAESASTHRKTASVSHSRSPSLVLDEGVSKLLEVIPPWSSRANKNHDKNLDRDKVKDKGKERAKDKADKGEKERERDSKVKFATVSGKENNTSSRAPASAATAAARSGHTRSQSQPKLQVFEEQPARGVSQTKRQHAVPSVFSALSPVKHSPPGPSLAAASSTATSKEKENASKTARTTRKPLGPRAPSPPSSPALMHEAAALALAPTLLKPQASKENAHREKEYLSAHSKEASGKDRRRSQILRDVTSARKQDENVSPAPSTISGAKRGEKVASLKSERSARDVKVEKLKDADLSRESAKAADTSRDSVRNRMKEWERERERLKEMERVKERMREAEEEREREREREREQEERAREREREEMRQAETRERERSTSREREREREREPSFFLPKISVGPPLSPTASAMPVSPLCPLFEEPSQLVESPTEMSHNAGANESGISALKQSLRMSIGGAVRLYKSSTQLLGRSTPALTLGSDNADEEDESRMSLSARASWEDDALVSKAKSSLPTVRHAVRTEQVAAENKLDRMTIWIQNVEKVVDEARQNFAASTSSAPLPPLPLAPVSRRSSYTNTTMNRSGRGNRVPRRILPANQIFVDGYEPSTYDRSGTMSPSALGSPLPSPSFLNTMNFAEHSLPTIPSELPSRVSHEPEEEHEREHERSRSYNAAQVEAGNASGGALMVPETPSKKRRRATVVTRSPETKRKSRPSLEIDVSPSKRREKSKSHSDLVRPITPITKLEFELERLAQPTPTPRLSAVVDKNLFIARSPSQRVTIEESLSTPPREKDDLTASPLHVEPYPARPRTTIAIDTPAKRHLEGVYDRFLMSTTGVKRNGKGYQSDNVGPVGNVARPHSSMAKRSQKFFNSTRRPMPPPVSSDDLRRSSSVDEFGTFCPSKSTPAAGQSGDHNKNTIAVVRKAFKAIVTGKPAARGAKPVWV